MKTKSNPISKVLSRLSGKPPKAEKPKAKTPKAETVRKRGIAEMVESLRGAGYFVEKEKKEHVYVPRKRVSDRLNADPLIHEPLESFTRIADKVISDSRTMMRYDRLFTIWQSVANTSHLEGSMAEVGVWRGGTSYLMSAGRRELAGKDALIVMIDTFEGHPEATIDAEHDPFQRAGGFAGTSVERVASYLADFPHKVRAGDAVSVVDELEERTYFLVHIDTDIHVSTKKCLEYFYPRMVRGGVIVMDDFGAKRCPGVTQAVQEYLLAARDCYAWQMQTEQCVIVKS